MARKVEDLSDEVVQEFLNSFDTVLTDCDGVLWKGNESIQGSAEAINLLRSAGKKIIYVTNNSTKSRKQYVKKCQDLGFGGSFEDIFTTSFLCARYLTSSGFNKKVYIFGNKGIAAELDDVNIAHMGTDLDGKVILDIPTVVKDMAEEIAGAKDEVGCVIVSFNPAISYKKMAVALTFLKRPDCIFIGTNRDQVFPMEGDFSIPGTGAFIAAMETAAERPATILGKPEKFMFDAIRETHDVDPERCIMIGDRCNTDIMFGKRNGIRTLLVGTGVNSYEEVKRWRDNPDCEGSDPSLVPDFYIDRLGGLVKYVKKFLIK